MGVLVYVLGRTGTGKSYSMRNFPKDKLAVINVQGKILPFRGGASIEQTSTDDSTQILTALDEYANNYKSIVVDDYQYLMSNEFMRRAFERGYDKFTEIAAHAWNIADKVRSLPTDTIVYIMCHTDTDSEGVERLKTIGKLLDEKIYLEGMSTIVLKTVASDGKYCFVTQNNGKDTVKSPADMFPAYAIDNDLYYVDQKIREYYGLGATMSANDLAKADESAANEDIQKPEKRSRRSKPEKERKEVRQENDEAIANAGTTEDGEPQDFNDIEMPEVQEMPRRKKRSEESEEQEQVTPSESEEVSEDNNEEAPRRRRRRRAE